METGKSEEIQEQLFAVKSKFLREIPHPRLIHKAMEQVRSLQPGLEIVAEVRAVSGSTLVEFLQAHSDALLSVKLRISNAGDPATLYQALQELYHDQWLLIERLAAYLPVLDTYPDENIKLSDPVNSYDLLRFIASRGLAENQIKPYICDALASRPEEGQDNLLTACLRCRKILINAGAV